MEDPFIGKTIGSHKILEKVGEGGMGSVYRAIHANLQREDALKILPDRLVKEHPEVVERFLVEARAAAKINNPHIVQVHDAGVLDGVHYISMEFVRGLTLKALMAKKSPIPLREAVKIIIQAAKGLKAAAREKVIHRDIKPANVMLADQGIVKVADFGLAKNLDADLHITHSGQSLGTPAYMSPEQGEGESADFRSDIYSLGCTFFEMVTGSRPFSAESVVGLLMKHAQAPVPDPLSINPGLPPAVGPLVQKMMAKSPDERHQSYDELIRDFMAIKNSLEKGGMPSGDETPLSIHPDSDKTPVTMHSGNTGRSKLPGGKAGAGKDGEPDTVASGGKTGILVAEGLAGVALIVVALLAVLGVFGGGGESSDESPDPMTAQKKDEERDGEEEIGKTLKKAEELEKKGRYRDALNVLSDIARIDPDHKGAEIVRKRLERALDESRAEAEKESLYKKFWASADADRARADISDKSRDWELVIISVGKALENMETSEALDLAKYAAGRRDWALAREAEARGELEKAVTHAKLALTRGADLDMGSYLGELEKRLAEARTQEDEKKRFGAMVKEAEESAKSGARPESLLESWRKALALAPSKEDRARVEKEITGLEAKLVFQDAMKTGTKAEEEGRWEEARSSYEKAVQADPDHGEAKAALERTRAKLAQIKAKVDEDRKAEERKRLLVTTVAEAEAAEKRKVRGRTGDHYAALVLWRKALSLQSDPGDKEKIESRIKALINPVFRRAMVEGRNAEVKKDWVDADRSYKKAAEAKPEDRNLKRAVVRVQEKLAGVLKLIGASADIPKEDLDGHGNPVDTRNGAYSDPESGLPYEIWLKEPRVEMVLIPVGKFKMGSPRTEPGHQDDESPQINMHMGQPYYMGKYEVTQAQWKALVEKGNARFEGVKRPMERISWRDATKFCEKLNTKIDGSQESPPYFCLPAESEWEYAARAGTVSPYWMGKTARDLLKVCWFKDNGENCTHAVGRMMPNPWGLYDIHGNVWEWCLDTHSDSLARRSDNPDPAKKGIRVLRGGRLESMVLECRCACRKASDADVTHESIGMRLCFKLHTPPKEEEGTRRD